MRWFKHLTAAHSDDALSGVREQYGAEGYGVYWLIVEHIAGRMEPGKMEPSATHSDVEWTRICGLLRTQKFHNIIDIMVRTRLIHSEDTVETVRNHGDNRVRTLRKLTIPNILKYKDEYSKKSGVAQEQDREQIQIESRDRKPLTPSAAKTAATDAPTPLDLEITATVDRMLERHPDGRKCSPKEAADALRSIVKKIDGVPGKIAKLAAIDHNHQKHCETDDWSKDGGKYAKGLANWLAPTRGRFDMPAPIQRELIPSTDNGHGVFRSRAATQHEEACRIYEKMKAERTATK